MDTVMNKQETKNIIRVMGPFLLFLLAVPFTVLAFLMIREPNFDFSVLVYRFFSPHVLAISLFYTLSGILVGLLTALSIDCKDKAVKQENVKTEKQQVSHESSLLLARQIWPTLNKARQGLELIDEKRKIGKPEEQTMLIQVTRDNLDNLSRLLDVIEKNKVKRLPD